MNKQYKTKMPWFRFYTADYVTATVNLSTVERAIWLELLRLFWEHGSLPDDLDKIRVNMLPLGRSRAYKLVSGVLEKCFERNDGRWFNPDFGDHHLKVGALSSQSPTLLCQTQPNFDPTLPNLDPTLRNLAKTRPWDGKKCSDINAPESL